MKFKLRFNALKTNFFYFTNTDAYGFKNEALKHKSVDASYAKTLKR